MNQRTLVTLIGLLRREAEQVIRKHGEMTNADPKNSIGLTPNEMLALADKLELVKPTPED